MRFKRRKIDAVAKAAEIKAKHEAKRQEQGLFTPSQEALMDELGLKPGTSRTSDNTSKADKNTKARDPLTARQRKLAEELGLAKPE